MRRRRPTVRVQVTTVVPPDRMGGAVWINGSTEQIHDVDDIITDERNNLILRRDGMIVAKYQYWVRVEEKVETDASV